MTEVNLFVAFAAGIFSFLSPCVLPLIPSYLSFVSGVSLDEMRSDQGQLRWRVVLNSLAFIIGFSIVFVSFGASASFLGGLLMDFRNTIRIGGGILVLLVGLYLVGAFRIAAFEQYLQFNLKDKPAGYLGSVLVGITFAVAWTPCVGPILGATLALASTEGEVLRGVFLLTGYAAGLAVPFFFERFGNQFIFAVRSKVAPLYPDDSRDRRCVADRRRSALNHRLHDPAQCVRNSLHARLVA